MYQKKNMSVWHVIQLLDRFSHMVIGKTPDHRPRWYGHQKDFVGSGVNDASNGPGEVFPWWLVEGVLADREKGRLGP